MLKVGPHASTNPTGLGVWLSARPTVAVYQGAFYADAAPGCLIVGRPVNTDYLTPSLGNAVEVATRWWNERVWPTAAANPHIKTWIASNEPDWKDKEWSAAQKAAAMQWYGEFDYTIAKLAAARGLRMVLGNPAVGCFEVEYLKHWVGGLKACREFGAYYGGHYYGPLDKWHAFKFVEDLRAFDLAGYSDIQILGTEGGAENVAGGKPWLKQYGSVDRYVAEWVRPFELRARQYPRFVGLALFTLGDPGGWKDYDVAGYEFPAAMVKLSNELGAVQTIAAPKPTPAVTVPAVPAQPTTPAPGGKAKTYTVKSGDTLTRIAIAFSTSVADLLKINPEIVNANLIRVGQVIRTAVEAVTPAPHPDIQAQMPVVWDISRYQERWYGGAVTQRIDWDAVAGYKGEYAPDALMIRASVYNETDWSFSRSWPEARRIGKPRAPYMAVGFGVSASAQLKTFLRQIGDDPGELRPMIDVEQNAIAAYPYHSRATATQYAKVVEAVAYELTKRFGKTPILYTADWFWAPTFLRNGITTNFGCPLMVATYPLTRQAAPVADVRAGKYKPRVPLAWKLWDIWQFTDSARVPGVTANTVDVSIVRRDFMASFWR